MEILDEQQNIEKRLADLEATVKDLEKSQFKLTRFLPKEDKLELQILNEEQILDTVWNEYYYSHTFFESLDGWPNGGGGTKSVASNRLYMQSSGTTTQYVKKKAIYQNVLSYETESRFRSSFSVDDSLADGEEVSSLALYIGTGHAITGGSNNLLDDGLDAGTHYGFVLSGSTLYGVTSDGSAYTYVELMKDVKFGNLIGVEARFYPRDRVDFYTTDQFDGVTVGPFFPRGSLSVTLPTGPRYAIAEFSFYSTGGTRSMNVGFSEIAQKRTK